MIVLVCGGRDFAGDRRLSDELNQLLACHPSEFLMICGYNPADPRYQGADQLAWEWAGRVGVARRAFPADWRCYGRSAGPRRNSEMAAQRPAKCIAFPRANGRWGDGTLDMITKARRAGAEIHQIETHNTPIRAEDHQ